MAFDAGTIDSTLTLDRDPFTKSLAAAVAEARRFERRRFTAVVDLNTRPAVAKLNYLERRLQTMSARSVQIKTDVSSAAATKNINRLRAQLATAGRDKQNVSLGVDTKAATAATTALQRNLARVARTRTDPVVRVRGVSESQRQVGQLRDTLGRFTARSYGPRLKLDGVDEAKKQVVELGSTVNSSVRGMSTRFAALGGIVLALSPLIASVGVAAVGALGGVLSTVATLGAGFSSFGLVAIGVMGRVTEAVAEGEEAIAKLPPPLQRVARGVQELKQEFKDLQTRTQGAVSRTLVAGMKSLVSLMRSLDPLVTATADAVTPLLRRLSEFFQTKRWAGFVDFFAGEIGPTISKLGSAVGNLVIGVLELAKAFAPLAQWMLDGIADGMRRFAKWAAELGSNKEFQYFLDRVRASLPEVMKFLGNVVALLWNMAMALEPVGTVVLKVFNWIIGALNSMNPAVLQTITAAVVALGASLLLLGTGPVGLVVGAVAALAAGLIYLWNRFEGVREVVGQVGSAVKSALSPVLNLFKSDVKAAGSAVSEFFAPAVEKLGEFFNWLWGVITRNAGPALKQFSNGLMTMYTAVRPLVKGLWEGVLKPMFSGIGRVIMEVAVPALKALWNNAGPVFKSLMDSSTWLWKNALKPLFSGIGWWLTNVTGPAITAQFNGFITVMKALGSAASWLWKNVLKPVFNGIGWVLGNVVVPAFQVWWKVASTVWNAVSKVVQWAWNNVIKPVFNGITWALRNVVVPAFRFLVGAVQIAWKVISKVIEIAWGIIKIVFAAIAWAIKNVLGATFRWLYNKVVKPVWEMISRVVRWAWNNVMKPVWNAVKVGLRVLGRVFDWLWKNVVRPVWNGISSAVRTAWRATLKPVFDTIKTGINRVAKAFQSGRGSIGKAWRGIQNAAKAPVKFLVETVYNDGIMKMWNKVANLVDADKLSPVNLPKGFARGGILPGDSSWRHGDSLLVPKRPGEGTYVSEAMRDPYERARLSVVNRAAMAGKSLQQYRDMPVSGAPLAQQSPRVRHLAEGFGFARGGWLNVGGIRPPTKGISDNVGGFIKDVAKAAFTGDMGKAVNTVFRPMKSATAEFGKNGLPGVPYMLVSKASKLVREFVVNKWNSFQASLGGGGGLAAFGDLSDVSAGLRRAANFVKATVGRPYVWGGGGPGYDCSGYMAAIQKALHGPVNPNGHVGRLYTTMSFRGASAPAGWKQGLRSPFEVGVINGSSARGSHMAGTLLGVNVESSGSRGTHMGRSARGSRDGYFTHQYGYRPVVGGAAKFDRGGTLPPGYTMSFNGTGRSEPVFTHEQLRALGAAGVGGGDRSINLTVQASPGERTHDVLNDVLFQLRSELNGGAFADGGV